MKHLQFSASAKKDLIRLREFIAKHNPEAARRVGQRLKVSIQRLTEQPDMGVNVEDLSGVQELIADDYIVRYLVRGEEIYILRIWHRKEDR